MERIQTRSALLALLAVLVAACAGNAVGQPSPSEAGTTTASAPAPLAAPDLIAFDACDSFLDYMKSHAVEQVGPYGLQDPFTPWWGGRLFEGDGAMESAAPTSEQAGSGHSGTNVQVEGVDEPDLVKTDGRRLVVLSEGSLIVVDVTGSVPETIGRLHLGNRNVQSLFLSGDRVLLFGSMWTQFHPLAAVETTDFAPVHQSPSLELVEVDISEEPEIVRTMTIDGRFISGRMIGDTIRLVSTSGPVGFEWAIPTGTGLRAERRAIDQNKEIIRRSRPDNWIPYYVVSDPNGNSLDEGTLFDCTRASHPEAFAGLNMLSVITIDLDQGLEIVDATGVLASGEMVYASPDSLYVATQDWNTWSWGRGGLVDDEPESVSTDIHKFDISDPLVTTYRATGSVDGYLLNQFAMDESNGLLRIASTTSPSWWGPGEESESMISILDDDGAGELALRGVVSGLGKTEQIYSVRFMGDTAYVVTFRQVDPLYTIDLSDPTRPKVMGELKILGYSAYLHPVGEGLVMGVGQDATEDGRIEGTQVSLFDVSDLANPVRLDQVTLAGGSSSQVESDHHAFLYWEAQSLAVVPVQQWWWDGSKEEAFSGAVGLRVVDGELQQVAKFAHPGGDWEVWDGRAQIFRSVVIGESLYTISAKGIMKSDLATLDELEWLGF